MARLYKKPLYRPVPLGAKIITAKNGTKYAVWSNADGEKTAKYLETANGPRIVEESQVYVARYTDATGRFRERSTGCRDLRAAEHKLNVWLQEVDKIKAGIISEEELEVGQRLKGKIDNFFPGFTQHLKSKSATKNHIDMTIARLKKICVACRFVKMTDIKADPFLEWLQALTDSGLGAATRNGYRKALTTFCNWAVSKDYLRKNPIKKVPKLNEELDIRHGRRAYTKEEIGKLLKAAQERPLHEITSIRQGPQTGTNNAKTTEQSKQKAIRTGLERKLIYATLLYTGLRKNELASITFSQVFLNDKIPHIYLKANSAKSRKAAKLPLHPELLKQLKEWTTLREKEGMSSPKDKLFHVPISLSRILARDLVFAGIEQRDAMDRVVDVHALRHTYATTLVRQGVPITVVQKAMRHADLRTTMRYSHTELENVSDGIGKLPDFLSDKGSDEQ